jgi:hypothetical protein
VQRVAGPSGADVGGRGLRQVADPAGVRGTGGPGRAVGAEPFGGEGAHDRQHPAPGLAVLVRDVQERRVRHAGQADRGARTADVLDRVEVEAGREHRQRRQ